MDSIQIQPESAVLLEVDQDDQDRALLRQLQSWLQHEKDRQAENRYQMALDGEYYDGNQWREEDAKIVEDRGQAALTFNETAVHINWLAGTEKRSRVDWRVLPRTPDDSEGSGVKTKVMKYVSDVNNVPFVRSATFLEAAISGLSWIEDSLSADATDDILYCGHQSWRTAYHDSYHLHNDARDMRYFFRFKVLDVDVAKATFPDHKEAIDRAAVAAQMIDADSDDDLWYLGTRLSDRNSVRSFGRTRLASVVNAAFSERTRVKIWECWYRKPTKVLVVRGGQFDGELYDEQNAGMAIEVHSGQSYVHPSVIMRVCCAFFTDDKILEAYESPFKHNDIPFTPVYAFRRQKDGLPYGYVRNMRDPQDDLNKRMSKSLFLLSVNQLITEKDAFDEDGEYTLQDAIDNVSNPQGVFILKDGTKKFEIRRDYMEEQSQMQHVSLDRQFLQSASGVTDELLGRRTNATSGRAIEARQDQGSLATAGIFDNFRLAIRLSGQKQLSNAEKFYSMPKVIRLTESKGQVDWVRINQPEVDPVTGEVRFINDITATKADFIVDEQDYRSSMRQAMFESLSEMATKVMQIAPQLGIGILDLVVDLADFPGKDELVERLRTLIAEARGEGPKNPEAEAAVAEEMELAKQAAAAKIAKDEAAANKADAEADQIRVTLPPMGVALDLQTVPQGTVPATGMAAGSETGSPGMTDMGMTPNVGAPGAPNVGTPDPFGAMAQALATMAQVVQQSAQVSATAAQTSAQVMQGLQALAGTMEAVAAGVEGVAAVAERAQQSAVAQGTAQTASADASAAALDAVSASVERVTQAVSEVTQAVTEVAQVATDAKESAEKVAQALAEAKKPRNKVIEFKNAQGQTIRATIKG